MSEETILPDVQATQDNLFTTTKGVVVQCTGISPFKLQMVQKSVPIPEPPRYTVKTAFGKEESFFLDAVSAPTFEYGQQVWDTYQRDRLKAMELQNDVSMKAIFGMGCKVLDWGKSAGWEDDYEPLGISLPDKPKALETFYLMNELTGSEITELTNKIMLLSGATEEDVKKAEATFRPDVPA